MRVLFVAYDNESHISYFPIGLSYLAAILRAKGCDVSIYNQDVYHFPEDHLVEHLKEERYDVIGVGIIGGYYTYRKLLRISRAIQSAPNRPFYVIGGHGPSAEPEFFLDKTQADAVVIGEGEAVLANLVDALADGRSLSTVRGIAYREGESVAVNEREQVIEDIDAIPMPAWDLFPMEHYVLRQLPGLTSCDRCFHVVASRGCLFSCTFCYRMDPGYRRRSADSIIEEMGRLKTDYHVTGFDFNDELFMCGASKTIAFCEQLMRADLGIRFACQGRLNFATPDVLKAMKHAGCVFIGYGVESLDEGALKGMNKNLTVKQIVEGVENTLAADIMPGLYVMWGNIGETADSLDKAVEFLLKYNAGDQLRTVRPVTPYPGCELYDHARREGLLDGPEDFYERKHVNSDLLTVNFTGLSDEEFHGRLFEANRALVEDYIERRKLSQTEAMRRLYVEGDASFRGFRTV